MCEDGSPIGKTRDYLRKNDVWGEEAVPNHYVILQHATFSFQYEILSVHERARSNSSKCYLGDCLLLMVHQLLLVAVRV
jgi:hypothetical protein